jgi:predicted hydrocarbon binding protein
MAEMTRSDFMKCCTLGACSCSLVAISATGTGVAQSTNSEVDALKAQREVIRIRYAKLLGILDEEVDQPTRKRIFEKLGRVCADQFRAITYDKYKNDIRGFLAAIQGPSGWVEKAEYNEKTGTIRIFDRSKTCTCPLVDEKLTPADQCECTLGWQKQTYSAILGKPVTAELEESILRGSTRCGFRIQVV